MKGRILICAGTSGLSAGAKAVAEAFKTELGRHGLERDYAVVMAGDRGLFRDVLVDIVSPGDTRTTYQFVRAGDVAELVRSHLVDGTPLARLQAGDDYHQFFQNQTRIVLKNCGEIDPEDIDDYIAHGGYQALDKLSAMSPEEVVGTVKASGLRGRGGAGFSTGMKWEFCQREPAGTKYMVCNADEGDPGAFMDRAILESDPHAVIEGMVIAGYAIGAEHGYIYCRAEYPLAIQRLEKAIGQARERGYLGVDIVNGFSFDLKIKQGAGAFVCGEETALIASIEGRRGTPRFRPPFPAQSGIWGKPTTINNVETLANVPHIIARGADWFASMGTEGSKGTKVFAIAGKLKNTGLVEVPMGTTIRDLVDGPGGGLVNKRLDIKGVQLGGPSGGCLPKELLDTPIDYESINQTGAIMGSGGLIVMDQRSCMVDLARFFVDFTVAESCGKCVPCRVGLKRMQEVLEKITRGEGTDEQIQFLEQMADTIRSTSHCGLGQTAPNPVLTTLRYFRSEYDAHVQDKQCPSHLCPDLLKFEVINDQCVKCGQCARVCPADAISWSKGEFAVIDKEKCTKCRSCYGACGFMAIR